MSTTLMSTFLPEETTILTSRRTAAPTSEPELPEFWYGPPVNISTCGSCGACIWTVERPCLNRTGEKVLGRFCEVRNLGLSMMSKFIRLDNICHVDVNPCWWDPCYSNYFGTNIPQERVIKECVPTNTSFACECQTGFWSLREGEACIDINECFMQNSRCKSNGTLRIGTSDCVNTIGDYYCVCKSGFHLNGSGDCEDIDECAEGTHKCYGKGETCENTMGGYKCVCKPPLPIMDTRGFCCLNSNFTVPSDAELIFSREGSASYPFRSHLLEFSEIEAPVGRDVASHFYVTSTGAVVFLNEYYSRAYWDRYDYDLYYQNYCESGLCHSGSYGYYYWVCSYVCFRYILFDKIVPIDQAVSHYPYLDYRFDSRNQQMMKGFFGPYWSAMTYKHNSNLEIFNLKNDTQISRFMKEQLKEADIPDTFDAVFIVKFTNVYDFPFKDDPMTFHVVIATNYVNTYGLAIYDSCKSWSPTIQLTDIQIGFWFRAGSSNNHYSMQIKKRSYQDFYNVSGLSTERGERWGSAVHLPQLLGFALTNNTKDYIYPGLQCKRWIEENRVVPVKRCSWWGCYDYYPQNTVYRWCPRTTRNLHYGFRQVHIPNLKTGISCFQPISSPRSWGGLKPVCCYWMPWYNPSNKYYPIGWFAYQYNALITQGELSGLPVGMVMNGSLDAVSAWNRFKEQLLAYKACCIETNKQCNEFLRHRPFTYGALVRTSGGWWCDPHLLTLDGRSYTFNGLGQFVLSQGTRKDNETNREQSIRIIGLFKTPPNVKKATVTAGVAIQVVMDAYQNETSEIVQLSLSSNFSVLEVRVNRTLISKPTNASLRLNSETVITWTSNGTMLDFPVGLSVNAKVQEQSMVLDMIIDDDYRGVLSGLMGNYNGDKEDDIQSRSGSIALNSTATDEEIYDVAMTWAIDCHNPEEALFDYSENECEKYFNSSYYPAFMSKAIFNNKTLEIEAREVCGNNTACLFDSAVTGNLNLGKAAKESETEVEESREAEENKPPEFANNNTEIRVRVGSNGSVNVSTTEPEDKVTLSLNTNVTWLSLENQTLKWKNASDEAGEFFVSVTATNSREAATTISIRIQFCRCQGSSSCEWHDNTTEIFLDVNCNCTRGASGRYCGVDEDGCAPKPCYTKCTDVPPAEMARNPNSTGFQCAPCSLGFTGNGQECDDINECEDTPSVCDQNCTNTIGSYICSCSPGFVSLEKKCADINECENNPSICGLNSQCKNTIGGYDCYCLQGFRKLLNGTCININECEHLEDPCSEIANSTCVDLHGSYDCRCKNGFNKNSTGKCIETDDCLPTNNCSQICVNQVASYKCKCHDGFNLNDDGFTCKPNKNCTSTEEEKCIGGSCTHLDTGEASCGCKSGYELKMENGVKFCKSIDECSNADLNKCSPASISICHDTNPFYKCVCSDGYRLKPDNVTCIDIDECLSGQSKCDLIHGSCINSPGSYKCKCNKGFERSVNASGYTECKDINECALKLDDCHNEYGLCKNTEGSYRCECKTGFKGNGKDCVDIDECKNITYFPCDPENGICINTLGSYQCLCKDGFELLYNTCTDIDECKWGHLRTGCLDDDLCYNVPGSYECLCPNDYILQIDGKSCEPSPESKCPKENKCGSAICAIVGGEQTCSCPTGYSWNSKNKTCDDIDECKESNTTLCPASNLVRCENYDGGYECKCLDPEYQQKENATHCIIKNECENATLWKSVCHRNNKIAYCKNEEKGFSCFCPDGYFKELTNDGNCTDIDECALGLQNCPKEATCVNIEGGYYCNCPKGFETVGKSCQSVQQCLNNNGGCEQECEDLYGGFRCNCRPGFAARREKCLNIDQCMLGWANCDQICNSTTGTYQCSCQDGFALVNDTKCKPEKECSSDHGCSHLCARIAEKNTCFCPNTTGYRLDTDDKTCQDIDECEKKGVCGKNSHCVNMVGYFRCNCTDGYELDPNGLACSDRNGGWSAWSEWNSCSKSCEGGTQTRRRSCTEPETKGKGYLCLFENNVTRGTEENQTRACNTENCPLSEEEAPYAAYFSITVQPEINRLLFDGVVKPALKKPLADQITTYCQTSVAECCEGSSATLTTRSNPMERKIFTLPENVFYGSDTPILSGSNVTISVYIQPYANNDLCQGAIVFNRRRKRAASIAVPRQVVFDALNTMNETSRNDITEAVNTSLRNVGFDVKTVAFKTPWIPPLPTPNPTSVTTPSEILATMLPVWVIPTIVSISALAAAAIVIAGVLLWRRSRENNKISENGLHRTNDGFSDFRIPRAHIPCGDTPDPDYEEMTELNTHPDLGSFGLLSHGEPYGEPYSERYGDYHNSL